ncbi:MAG: ABC transporter substrate-binding protein [Opitutaceae bacterium]
MNFHPIMICIIRHVGYGLASVLLLLAGCAKPTPEDGPPLRKVVLQTDWFPQAEHGGFYQALAKGFYRDAGLEVEIVPGGPGAAIKIKVAKGDATFGMLRSDDAAMAVANGLPLVVVAATMQHDAEALLLHANDPVQDFSDLDGRTVMAPVSMVWIPFIQKKYGVKFDLIPTTYGLGAFLGDRDFIQSCFLTSEPYYAAEKGVAVRTLPLTQAGYDIYQGIVCRRELTRTEPDLVRAFIAATIQGWRDYLENDPTPANQLILARNGNMTQGQLDYSRQALIDHSLVGGFAERGETIGRIDLARVQADIDLLREFNVLQKPLRAEEVATTEFLPEEAR